MSAVQGRASDAQEVGPLIDTWNVKVMSAPRAIVPGKGKTRFDAVIDRRTKGTFRTREREINSMTRRNESISHGGSVLIGKEGSFASRTYQASAAGESEYGIFARANVVQTRNRTLMRRGKRSVNKLSSMRGFNVSKRKLRGRGRMGRMKHGRSRWQDGCAAGWGHLMPTHAPDETVEWTRH